ncbi:MAG TPA: gfo/Idh/MocA family oxidoreductase [Arenibacter sp.]|nr:gfo/Idh/MocA family oxidoreductase [Arenibacter sp.]|tara:strand:+ start:365 stop:1738 length:1374 start_codon:yes stop_codon:yes gene_type:complete
MTNYKKSVSRRKFLDTITTAALVVPFLGNSAVSLALPKKKLRHASIGVGGMGGHDLKHFGQHPDLEVVAICDVDEQNLLKAAELFPGARKYKDWRDLLEKEHNNIDSVNVSVPDHNHFAIAYQAIQFGKHVYCQKPLCHDVAEVRKLTEAAVKAGVVTQLGTQHASGKGDRTAVQLIKDGIIGKIKHAYLCSNRPAAIERYRLPGPRPLKGSEVPSNLDWNLWIGTAPMRPYAPNIYHPAIWRAWQDFGTGWSGDIGCHIFDAVWKGLDLKAPTSVMARVQDSWQESSERNGDTWPQGDHITWMFPGNELTASDILPIEWFDGEFYPPWEVQALFHGKPYPAESAILIGTEGALLIPHKEMPVLLPENKYLDYQMPTLEDRNHYHHFVDACLGGDKTESYFAQSGPMTEAILLGTVAIRMPDTVLKWDPVNMSFLNQPKANKFLQREYRKGWGVAGF